MDDLINNPTLFPPKRSFEPHPLLIGVTSDRACRASVIIPARNEEYALPQTLDALRRQVDAEGAPMDFSHYEVIVLLNNCVDNSADRLRRYQRQNPDFRLYCAETNLPDEIAHVGTARRMLMDTAYVRLTDSSQRHTGILSTDADTTVSPDWICRNLHAIEQGAEVVGGVIHLKAEDIALLDDGTLSAYYADRRYQRLVAQLESLLDPDPADPWPRHLEHFGASLACTPTAYSRAGGLPAVQTLEDVAFIDRLRQVDAHIRHDLQVCVYTSARLDGRAEVGLSGQLRLWQEEAEAGLCQIVESAAYLSHRFSSLAQLRALASMEHLPPLTLYPLCWHQPLLDTHPRRLSPAAFLAAIDCNRLINETFYGIRREPMHQVLADLQCAISVLTQEAQPLTTVPLESILCTGRHSGLLVR